MSRPGGYSAFARYYDTFMQNVDYPKRAERLDALIRQYKRTQNRILLDLACGTGSMSEAFAKLGYDVIGVDSSPEMLGCAMEKKLGSRLPIQYLCQDMRELDMFGTIDITVCLLDSLNHLPDLDAVKQVFTRVSLFAEPDGLFLFDVNTLYKHQQILADNAYIFENEQVYCGWDNHLCNETDVEVTLDFFERIGDHYHRSSECFLERAYPLPVLQAALEDAGLTVEACLDGDTYEELQETSQRALLLARKKSGKESDSALES